MTKCPLLPVVLALLAGWGAEARLGDDLAALKQRFGEPERSAKAEFGTLNFFKKVPGFRVVEVWLDKNGQSVFEIYLRHKPLSEEEEANAIVERQTPAEQSWRGHGLPGGGVLWIRTDSSWAMLTADGKRLLVCGPARPAGKSFKAPTKLALAEIEGF